MIRLLAILTIVFSLFSCKQDGRKADLNTFMLDNWETTYIKIVMPTANGEDSTSTFESDFMDNALPRAQSTYNADGTFQAWYLKDGEKIDETTGQWLVEDDQLRVKYEYGSVKVDALYQVTPQESGFSAVSYGDWDQDGVKDDTLWMRSKRIDL